MVRRSRGTDIDAACGQLRSNTMKRDREKAFQKMFSLKNHLTSAGELTAKDEIADRGKLALLLGCFAFLCFILRFQSRE